jgi:membrane protease YdiL (CAAX protease family)
MDTLRTPSSRAAALALTIAGMAYLAALFVLQREPGFSLAEPLFLFALLGVVFPLLAWLCTLKPRSEPAPREAAQLPRVLLYLAAFALAVLGWGFSWINAAFPQEPGQSIAQLAVKLVTMVLLPAWLFLGLRLDTRARLQPNRLLLAFIVMSLAYLAMQAVFGRGLTTLGELSPSTATLAWAIPLCWLWQTLEAGLCEEVLFRRILQEKIAVASGSQVAGVAWASLLFGLAHAPGLWLRAGHLMEGVAHATPTWAVAYSIVMIAPAGIAFGVLWARTRSLWLIVPLHGMVDLLPQLAPFIRAWTGGA